MIRVAAALALASALGGCAAPMVTSAQTGLQSNPQERRWPTSLETRLCPTPDAARTPYAACERIREPYVVLGRADRRDILAYRVQTDSGKTGFVESLDYRLASEGEDDRNSRLEREASAKAAKTTCDRKGGVSVGMTRAQVYASCWGKPQRINTTSTAGGDHEQLIYAGYNYLYLRNGVLTSIQTSK